MGKDQYYDSLEGMISGRSLPWVQDSESENYPIWSDFGASQRDVFFLDYNGAIDTSFSITPYSSSDPDDVQYLKELILGLRSNQALEIDNLVVPKTYFLHQNFPNPFNPTTSIEYDLPEFSIVNISIFDLMGRKVKSLINLKQPAGYQSIRWDGTNSFGEIVSTGMYIYTIQAGDFRQAKKMVLVK